MRHILISLFGALPKAGLALVIALGCCLAASPAMAADPQVARGEAAYGADCASCHRTPSRFMRRYLDMAPQERAQSLDRFLAGHHAPDAERRTAIVAWLMTYRRR